MLNLLPLQEKKSAFHLYRLRLLAVVLGALVLTLVIGIVSLMPSFFIISVKEKGARQLAESTLEKEAATPRESIEDIILSVNSKIATLEGFVGDEHISELFSVIIESRIPGISLNGLHYRSKTSEKTKLAPSEMNVLGVAANRETLTSYADRLRANSLFGSVSFPPESLIAVRDIKFTLTVILAP